MRVHVCTCMRVFYLTTIDALKGATPFYCCMARHWSSVCSCACVYEMCLSFVSDFFHITFLNIHTFLHVYYSTSFIYFTVFPNYNNSNSIFLLLIKIFQIPIYCERIFQFGILDHLCMFIFLLQNKSTIEYCY